MVVAVIIRVGCRCWHDGTATGLLCYRRSNGIDLILMKQNEADCQ